LGRMEKSIEIKAPAEKVWEILALDRMPEWNLTFGELKVNYTSEVQTPEDKYKVGAVAHIIDKSREHDVEITESLENAKMTYRSKPPYYRYTATYVLKPVEGGTKLTWTSDVEMPWGVFGKALGRLASSTSEKKVEEALEKLKSILEK